MLNVYVITSYVDRFTQFLPCSHILLHVNINAEDKRQTLDSYSVHSYAPMRLNILYIAISQGYHHESRRISI